VVGLCISSVLVVVSGFEFVGQKVVVVVSGFEFIHWLNPVTVCCF
jgi:hypothetical protein